MWQLLLFFIYLFVRVPCVLSLSNDLGEVVFVSILYRHGARTPIEPYPKDPYKNNSLWPVGWGELTDAGKRGHYKLGKWLRARYGDLLPKEYSSQDIYIHSTDVDRTLMSAYSNLAGLYEPDMNTNWNPNIKWTPIPVHTIPESSDNVLARKTPCPRYTNELNKVQHSFEFQKINEKYKKLYEYLTECTGMNVSSVDDVERVYDTLFIEEFNNFTLPNWTKIVYPSPMKDLAEISFSVPCYNKIMARLHIGLFLGEVMSHMEQKISNDTHFKRKAWMYSAHDTTVADVLKALNLFQPHCPPFLSLVLIELRKRHEDYFVAIHYRNSSSVPPYFMQLPGCDKLCPIDKFKEIVSSLVPKDWEKECQTLRFADNIYSTTASISFVTTISLALLFLLSFTAMVKFYKNQRKQKDFAYKSLKMEVVS